MTSLWIYFTLQICIPLMKFNLKPAKPILSDTYQNDFGVSVCIWRY